MTAKLFNTAQVYGNPMSIGKLHWGDGEHGRDKAYSYEVRTPRIGGFGGAGLE